MTTKGANPRGSTRRELLKYSTAAVAFPTIVSSRVLGRSAVAPGEKIILGVIGIGPRCTYDLRSMLAQPDVQCVAICDVQASRREAGKKLVDTHYGNKDCVLFRDYRELLARPDIDAVLVATGDRWHVPASIAAAQAGKDVYSEKPCGLTIANCQDLAETMNRTKRVFQAGTQRRACPISSSPWSWLAAASWASFTRFSRRSTSPSWATNWLPGEPTPPIDVVDWNLWLGPAPWRPYNHTYVNGGWRGFYDFDSGARLLDWGETRVDLCQWANGSDDTMPLEYEPGPTNITARYANGVKLVLDFLKTPFGDRPGWFNQLGTCPVRFVGSEGWVETGDNGGIEVHPASLKEEIKTLVCQAADDQAWTSRPMLATSSTASGREARRRPTRRS